MNSTPLKLPDEILFKIFEYLRVKDITSCRLVCRKWYSCCDARSIRKNENYVFHAGLLTSTEINDILVNHRASQISVEFVRVELNQLCFKEFGAKIQALTITDCSLDSLTNIFLCTPNMKSFTYYYSNKYVRGAQVKQLRELTMDLHKNDLEIRKLEKLECFRGYSTGCPTTIDLFSEPFASVFPRLTSISLPPVLQDMNESLKRLLIQNNVTELRKVCFPPIRFGVRNMDVPLCLQYDTIKLLPRFTKLDIRIDHTLDLCFELFSQQSCLETLEIHLVFQYMYSSSRKSEKQLLLHILENCKRLTTLHFYMDQSKEKCLHLNHTDVQLFKKVIAASNPKIDLVMPPITIDGSTRAAFFALFNGLKYLGTKSIINDESGNQTENFSPLTVCEELKEIINSQKSLEKLKFEAVWKSCDDTTAEKVPNVDKTSNVGHLRSDKLEHLELWFNKWTFIIVQTIILWEFPKLSTLVLKRTYGDSHSNCCVEPADLDLEYKNRFIDWIQSMPPLKTIHLHCFDLNSDQCLSICCTLPNLETICYNALDVLSESKIKLMFANCRALRKVVVHANDRRGYNTINRSKTIRGHYTINRSKNIIYFRKGEYELYRFYTSMT